MEHTSGSLICGKVMLEILSILECCCFAGLPYGWNSLVYILKKDHVFRDLCTMSNSTNSSPVSSICKQQNERLNLIFSVGLATVFVLVGYIGIVNTQFGEIKTRIIHMIVFAAGSLFLAFTSAELPWFLLPGIILIGIGGSSLIFTNIRVAMLFSRGSAVYACSLIGAFDTSAVMMLLIKFLYEQGIEHKYSFIGLLVLFIVISGSCTFFHWFVIDRNVKGKLRSDDMVMKEVNTVSSTVDSNIEKPTKPAGYKADDRSWKSCIRSVDYMMQLMWISFNVLNFVFFVGSLNTNLEKTFENTEEVDHFTNVLGYMMTTGVVPSLLAGLFQEWQKWLFRDNPSIFRQRFSPLVAPLCITSVLGIILRVLSFITTERWNLYTSFGVVLIYRAFIFGVNMNYIINVFPQKHATLLVCLNQSVFGIVSLLQYPLFIWRDLYEDANEHVSIAFIILELVSILQAVRTCAQVIKHGEKNE